MKNILLQMSAVFATILLFQPANAQEHEFTFGNSYYEIGQYRGSWYEAAEAAAARGGKLLTVESQAENDFIIENFWDHDRPGRIMLGINDVDEEGTWRNQDGDLVHIRGEGQHKYGYSNWFKDRADNISGEGQLQQADWGSIQDVNGYWDTTWVNGGLYYNGEDFVGGRTIYVFEYPLNEEPADPVLLQTGNVTVEADIDTRWHVVFFEEPMENPIVVMGPVSSNGVLESFTRVRNVTAESFEFQIDAWDYLDAGHAEETVSWLAVESGVHYLNNGQVIEAGSLTANTVQTEHTFTANFSSVPAVFGQVASGIDDDAIVTRIDDVTLSGFDYLFQEEEASFLGPVNAFIPSSGSAKYDNFDALFPSLDERAFGEHEDEVFHYVALSEGDYGSMLVGSSNGIEQDTHEPIVIDFSGAQFIDSGLLLQTTSMDAYNPATARLESISNESATVFFQEEASYDPELRRRFGDSYAWLAMEPYTSIGRDALLFEHFEPDPNKIYHIDNPALGLRLAAVSGSEELVSRPIDSSDEDTQWQFVPSPTPGLWHIQRAAGGDTPRIRTDKTQSPDMQEITSSGVWTQFSIEANPNIPGTYLLTIPYQSIEYQRLRLRADGTTEFTTTKSMGNWPSFVFVEVN